MWNTRYDIQCISISKFWGGGKKGSYRGALAYHVIFQE